MSWTDISNGVKYMYGIPDDKAMFGPSLILNTLAKG